MKRTTRVRGAAVFALLIAGGAGLATIYAQGRGNTQVPKLEVEPLWPKPFPVEKHWAMGSVTGVFVDAQDHVWVSNRGLASLQGNEKGPTQTPWASECCMAAPQILEFDPAGTLLNNWGGPGQGYQWPQNPSGIAVDAKGNVWITAGGLPAAAAGGGRGRGAAPAAPGAAAPGGAPAGAGAPAGGGRGGRGGGAPGGAPGGAAAAGGAAPAAGADAAAAGGRGGGRGRGAAPGGAAAGAAPGGAPAAAAAPGGAPQAGGRGGAAAAPAPPAVADAHILKFSKTGQLVLQIGKPGDVGTPDSTTTFNGPQGLAIDDAANEVYVADSGNKRVVVIDANTGAFKRQWAAAGSKTFADVSCVKLGKDGMIYTCDSANNRIVVFQKDGKFVKEGVVKAGTGGFVLGPAGGAQGTTYSFGSVWDIAFSNDAQQRFLYVADGMNKTVWVVQKDTLAPVSRFGDGGRYPGTFYAVGSVAVDSKGNVYTGEESDGKRVQKWINRGMGAPQPLN